MVVWSGKNVAEYVEDVDEEMIQPNGTDLRVDEVYSLDAEAGRKLLKPDEDGRYNLSPFQPYIIKFANKVRIPEKTVGMFFVRSTMWRKRGIIIQASLWDTGYVGRGEILVMSLVDSYLVAEERFGQIVFLNAEDTVPYNGQYQEEKYEMLELQS